MASKTELSYYERLNISLMSISKIKKMLKNEITLTMKCWENGQDDVEKQCFRVVGPAGVGKTQICQQIASEISEELGKPFEMIMVKAPVLSRDDFIIPFPIITEESESFKMLYSDFVPTDPDSCGIFVIDEMSRGDHALQQLMWQVQNEGSIHLKSFPKNWFVICLDNPDDQMYSMDTLEDAAGLRRNSHVYTEVNAKDFLNHAIESGFHQAVIEYITTHPDRLYDFDSQKLGRVFANPASYEKVSNQLHKYELAPGGIMENLDVLEPAIAGLINTHGCNLLLEFMRENKDINPKDIFNDYNNERPRVLKMCKESDNAALGSLITALVTFLSTARPKYKKKEMTNIATFLSDIPIDTAAVFVSSVDSFDRSSDEFKYIIGLHGDMRTIKSYQKLFFEKIVNVGKNAS